ncbi:transcriptional regulator ATRX-like isoform X2 [Quillaja saponaria]|uniref:Transcriptional regulator ATRX-like isoform X2 n=1 Tax=Quillaja saponaria TaxID=32244 RepID=A0AAD7PRA7_QUISA|nr:transcriptional regulator ATRX-like isoform X2 [Quillaja saponaria]
MCTSKSTTAGCLAGIFRRILCSGSLPTHPSDEINQVGSTQCDKDQEFKCKENYEATNETPPGIVARLMGLDSMPGINLPSTKITRNLVSRSRSMSSLDHLGEWDQKPSLHRRVKSNLSSRAVPLFLELENENYFILSFESESGNAEFRTKQRKSELGSAKLKQRRSVICKSRENRREGLVSVNNDGCFQEITKTLLPLKGPCEKPKVTSEAGKSSYSINSKEIVNGNGKKLREKKKKTNSGPAKKIELEKDSEDSSPVSVLEFDRQGPRSDIGSCSAKFNSRRILSPELDNDKNISPRINDNLIINERKMKAIEFSKNYGTKKKVKHIQKNMNMWGEICRVAEDELIGSNWIDRAMSKQDDLESITSDFELEILHQILNEVIDELGVHYLYN